MWDHHHQLRFTLAWAAVEEEINLRNMLVESVYATFRGQHAIRTEPEQGFQIHKLKEKGIVYFKLLFVDGRQCKMREVRYRLFEMFKQHIR